MDDEILKTVESMLGTDIKVVDCEKTSSVREEEVLLINGIPVQIEGEDGIAIKSALMTGQVPPCDLLNQLLYRAGILRQPVHLETSLSVKSSVIRKEEVTVARHGKILNERRSETQENNIYTSSCKEVWEPVNKLGALKTIIPIPVDRCLLEDDGNAGNAFLLAAPPQGSRIDNPHHHRSAAMESQKRKDSIPPPSTTASSSSSSSASFYRPTQPICRDTTGGAGSKSFSYTDCRRSPTAGGGESVVDTSNPTMAGRIGRPSVGGGAKTDSAKKLLNCMSFDSGHDDFFNSLSQSNFLSAVTGTCGSCSGFDDETHASGTPTLHSNSISSCYDFISSSDEADHQPVSSVGSTAGPDLSPKMPTIFGTVASDQCPKDSVNRKGFPQTTSCIKSSSSIDKTQQPSAALTSTGGQPVQLQHALSTHSPQSNVLRSQQLHDQPPHHYLHHHHHHHRHLHHQPHHHLHHNHQQQQHSHQQQQPHQHAPHKPLDNEENALVYRDGNLISGPLDTLIQHMVPTSDYYPDRSYLFAFLLSARLFIRPHELLAKICQLCAEQQDLNCTADCRCACSTMLDQTSNSGGGASIGIDQVDQAPRKPLNNQLLAAAAADQQKYRCCEAGAGAGDTTTKPCPAYCDDQQQSECCRKLRQFAQHFVRLLAEWIDTFPYDFRDERLMQHVRAMTRKCIGIDSSLRKEVQTMLQELLQRLTVLERYEEFLLSLSQCCAGGPNNAQQQQSTTGADSDASASSIKNNANAAAAMNLTKPASSVLTIQNNLHSVGGEMHSSSTTGAGQPLITSSSASSLLGAATGGGAGTNAYAVDISQLCPSPFLLAHQLTHIELERLSYIGPEEFVQAFAKENPHLEQSFSDMKKTRNLESYVQWFNRLSYLVATEIVKHPKKKQRVRIVEYWIETARECFNIGNFNSLMAIIAGLNMSPISRLKKTWSKVQSAKFLVLEHQMDPSSNFNSYRSTLKAAMWRSEGATDERERIVIPFFSLLVKDLYFLNEGCSNKLVNGHINFEKFWQLAKQVTEFIAWKQVSCPFEKLPKVIMFLQSSSILNENRLAIASFECEPPENNHEKERYKSLKYEQQQQQQQQHHNLHQGQHHQQHQHQ